MKQTTKIVLGSGITICAVLAMFLLPVVPISVPYMCEALQPAMCPSISTFVSVTYASFRVGEVYVGGRSFGQYCWMEGDPVRNPNVNNGAMCNSLTE